MARRGILKIKQEKTMSDEVAPEIQEEIERATFSSKQFKKKVKKASVAFYVKTARKMTYIARTKSGSKIVITGDKSVVRIDPADPQYDDKVEYLRSHKDNVANGGAKFFEIGPDQRTKGKCLLDGLLELGRETLITMIDERDKTDVMKSRGQLIMKILAEKGCI